MRRGGMGGSLTTIVLLFVVAGGVLGWARVNNINSVPSAYEYFKSWSDKADECYGDGTKWNCKGNIKTPDPKKIKLPKLPDASGKPSAPQPNNAALLAQLEQIPVKAAGSEPYNRAEWKHWSIVSGACDTRETVLKNQGSNVVADPSTCRAVSGSWIDPYAGEKFTDSSKLDIDHVIPLNYAAQHGGNQWSSQVKEQFANDMSQLLAASASENRKKSDKGPGKYMPPNKDFVCTYSTIWVQTAIKYGVWIEVADKAALVKGIRECK